jgi:hypothetical protein
VVLNDESSFEWVDDVTKRLSGHHWLFFMSIMSLIRDQRSDVSPFDPLLLPKRQLAGTLVIGEFPKTVEMTELERARRAKTKGKEGKVLSDPNLPSARI